MKKTVEKKLHNANLGQVFTKVSIANAMVDLLDLPKNASILDPCFGGGVFLNALLSKSYTNIEGYEIDPKLVSELQAKRPNLKICCTDFLNTSKKYDGIIMNPPYVRQENIDNLAEYGITKDLLRSKKIFEWLPKNANLYMYFVVKAIELLKEEGQLVVIFPDTWSRTKTGKLFKQYLQEKCEIAECISMENNTPFDDNVLTNVIILKIIKRTNKQKCPNCRNRSVLDPYLPLNLLEIAKVRRGITTGSNELFINPPIRIDDASLVPVLSSPKSYCGYNANSALLDKVLVVNKKSTSQEVKEYLDTCSRKIIKNQKPKSLYNKVIHGVSWYPSRIFDCSGLIFSYFVRSEMKFAVNPSGTLVRDNFYVINSDMDIYLLFALMNNYFTYYQLEEFGKKYGAGLLKIQCYDLERVRLPDIKKFSPELIVRITDEAKRTLETNNADHIRKITKIIADEIGFNYENIENMYNSKKNRRLNAVTR